MSRLSLRSCFLTPKHPIFVRAVWDFGFGENAIGKIFLKLLEERRSVLRKISQNGIEVEMLPAPIFWYNGADG